MSMNLRNLKIALLILMSIQGAEAKKIANKISDSSDYTMNINLQEFCDVDPSIKKPAPTPTATPEPVQKNSNCSDCIDKKTVEKKILPFLPVLAPRTLDATDKKKEMCSFFSEYAKKTENKPVEVIQNDSDGKKWKIKFFFGPTRTDYLPTNVTLKSTKVNVVIRDFTFGERTGQNNYSPKNWNSVQSSFQWIDEPTNTMILEFQKGNNSFFINVFHPKFLTNGDDVGTHSGLVQGIVDGEYVNKPLIISDDAPRSDVNLGVKLKNTHRQMDWQIGYGRNITLTNTISGKVVLQPHVAIGITTGKSESTYVDSNGNTMDYSSNGEVQGINATLGARLSYEVGRFGFFTDESYTQSQLQHPFLDGNAYYDMRYLTNTLGVSFQLNKNKKK